MQRIFVRKPLNFAVNFLKKCGEMQWTIFFHRIHRNHRFSDKIHRIHRISYKIPPKNLNSGRNLENFHIKFLQDDL